MTAYQTGPDRLSGGFPGKHGEPTVHKKNNTEVSRTIKKEERICVPIPCETESHGFLPSARRTAIIEVVVIIVIGG
jgi:hypothetical protein